MVGRIMVAVGTLFLASALWFGLQPTPHYVNYPALSQPESYFPVSPAGGVKLWYARRNIVRMGTVLQAIEEPTLYYRTEEEEALWEIRFVLLPETGEPLIARVRPTDEGFALVVKQARLDADGHAVGTRTVRTRDLSQADVDELRAGLEALSFFSLAGPAPEMEVLRFGLINLSVDRSRGDLWGVEWRAGQGDDDYHLVLRDSRVDLTGFETLARRLFARAGITPVYADHPVVDYSIPKAGRDDEVDQ